MRSMILGFVLLAVVALGPSAAGAASPTPAMGDQPPDPQFQTWLDEPLPPDVPVGQTLPIGLTIWDTQRGALFEINSLIVRVGPRTGKAAPTETIARSDWPGHLVAEITIPKGGLGPILAGAEGQACDASGTCRTIFTPFTTAGVGPPPDAPRSVLLTATLDRLPQPVTAGRPFTIGVSLEPRAEWGIDTLGLPDHLVAGLQLARTNDAVKADLTQVGADLRYSGQLTPTGSGDAVLTIGIPIPGGPEDIILSSRTQLRIQGVVASPPAAPEEPGPPPAPDGPPLGLIAIIGVAVVLGGMLLYRRFGDL